jgi:hypothetical protein
LCVDERIAEQVEVVTPADVHRPIDLEGALLRWLVVAGCERLIG